MVEQGMPLKLEIPFDATQNFFISKAPASSEVVPSGSIFDDPELPATYHHGPNTTRRTRSDLRGFLETDLDVSRLNRIHEWLLTSRLRVRTHALHRQRLMARTIVPVEQTDLHLLWFDDNIYIKPLPDYLLSPNFWTENICCSSDLHACATGFLYSYAWLICHPSDFRIAKDSGLINHNITYSAWTSFMDSVVSYADNSQSCSINKRYHFGELQLRRINWIYRLAPSLRGKYLLRGYYYPYYRYSSFFRRNFGWLFAVFAVVTVLLTAMQVGLATESLARNQTFQNISYGLTVFSMLLPLVGAIIIFLLLSGFLVNNTIASFMFRRGKARKVEGRRKAGARNLA
jgi:succinate dehydrogenase/fumarate reductase cytochrome b subunit